MCPFFHEFSVFLEETAWCLLERCYFSYVYVPKMYVIHHRVIPNGLIPAAQTEVLVSVKPGRGTGGGVCGGITFFKRQYCFTGGCKEGPGSVSLQDL